MRKRNIRFLSFILTLSLVIGLFGMVPLTASAAPLTSMLTLTTSNYGDYSPDGYTWYSDGDSGGILTLTDFNVNGSPLDGIYFNYAVTGDVQIVLVGTSTVTGGYYGIKTETASSLTITGDGNVTVEGGNSGISCGNITINGSGKVNAISYGNGILALGDVVIGGSGEVNVTSYGYNGMFAYGDVVIGDSCNVTIEGAPNGIFTDGTNITINTTGIVTAIGTDGFGINSNYDNHGPGVITIDNSTIVKAKNNGGSAFESAPLVGDAIVFENGVGAVYGDVTLPGDLTVESGETLTISSGSSLTVPSGTTLTNNGTIENSGMITNNGTIDGSNVIVNTGTGKITGVGTIFKVNKVTINGSASITHKYLATGANKTLAHSAKVDVSSGSNTAVMWALTGTSGVASVNAKTGLVTFTGKEGTVNLKATSVADPSKSHSKVIKVVKNVTKLRTPLTARNLTVKKKISVKPVINDGNAVITASLTYKSSNPKVATVDANGNVKGIKVGKTTITIQSQNGKKATVKINVAKKAVKLKKFTLTGIKKNALTLQKGKTKDLKIKLAQSKASDLKVTFKSSKSSVAKVDAAGRITAVKKGTATITVKVGSKTVKVKVTVK
jgi:hypothetical protein